MMGLDTLVFDRTEFGLRYHIGKKLKGANIGDFNKNSSIQ